VREIGRRLGLAAIDVRLGYDNNGAKDTGEP